MAAQHKAEALRALAHVSKLLAGAEPIDGLTRIQLAATVEYAIAEVEAISETKRARRGAPASGEPA